MNAQKPEVLVVIPARGGSRTIPRKNLALVAGRPLIAWTIETALKASSVTRVVVSTDDRQIADISKELGAEVPFLRPANLAGADSPTSDAITHAVDWLREQERYVPDYVVVLQPTSPLRVPSDVDRSIALAKSIDAVGVVSVSPSKQHPYWTFSVAETGQLVSLPFSDTSFSRRQDLPPTFILNGAIYVVKTEVLSATRSIVPAGAVAYVMPEERSLDINTKWELRIADLILRDTTPASSVKVLG